MATVSSTSTGVDSNDDIPQWKKDLILRRRNQGKCLSVTGGKHQQLSLHIASSSSGAFGRTGQQPSLTLACTANASSVASAASGCVVLESSSNNANHTACSSSSTLESKMVQERVCALSNGGNYGGVGGDLKSSDSDSSEELHYGPGIVNKLKNKYLSLALRESNVKTRPSILHMRKATSLENLLDDDVPNSNGTGANRFFESRLHGRSNDTAKNVPNRYRNATRGSDMKRARSVETISRADNHVNLLTNEGQAQKKHEDVLIGDVEGSDKPNRTIPDSKKPDNNVIEHNKHYNNLGHRINRPKRVPLIMNEKEKPPADVVKQTKRIFETRAEQRIKHIHTTGDVAEKVAAFNKNIKSNKKPPIKQKPTTITNDKGRKITPNTFVKLSNKTASWGDSLKDKDNGAQPLRVINTKPASPDLTSLPSPIPDVFRINELNKAEKDQNTSLSSHTPDLIIHSSPIHAVTSPTYKINTVETFIREEIKHSNKTMCYESKCLKTEIHEISISPIPQDDDQTNGHKLLSESRNKFGNSIVYNFSGSSSHRVIPMQPLKLEINGVHFKEQRTSSPRILQQAPVNDLLNHNDCPKVNATFKPTPIPRDSIDHPVINFKPNLIPKEDATSPKPLLSVREIEKNAKNSANTNKVVVKSVDEVKIQVPKVKKPPRAPEQTSVVFKFTDRKDVPDYVGNDGLVRSQKVERPKVGDGGIILLPGASLDESFTDDDEEWRHSLEAPPSPCDVTFINDNILIDGRSSLSQKTKKPKMKISFVDSGPEVYEYPSESSVIFEDTSAAPTNGTVGHTVPILSGSTLANYTPKSSSDDFQLGITKSTPKPLPIESDKEENLHLEEVEEPILFSAGTNSDILF